MWSQEDNKEEKLRNKQQRRNYLLRLDSDGKEAAPSLDLVEAWNSKIASLFTTWDGRDRIEAAEVNIATSKPEEEKTYHWSELKISWPEIRIYSSSQGEPEWDTRDLADLYKDLSSKGNPEEETRGLEYSPEFSRFEHLLLYLSIGSYTN